MVCIRTAKTSSLRARAQGPTPLPRIVPTGGDTQKAAHGGNRINGLILPYELEDFGGTESVSRANQAAAFAKISLSHRSWRFSRRSLRNSSR